jgi:chemotaxis protein MotB
MTDPHDDKQTIIIVKRKAHADHGHHGGAWKIAYADFVTAMMAFFLVMWLINAANEKTRAQVASYFNPIKLTDTSTSKKGLNNPLDRTPAPSNEKAKSPEAAKATTEKSKPSKLESEKAAVESTNFEKSGKYSDEQLFKNPYGILGLLAGQAIHGLNGHAGKGLAIAETSQANSTIAKNLADPFDPSARTEQTQDSIKPLEKNIEPKPIEKIATYVAPDQPPSIVLPAKADEALPKKDTEVVMAEKQVNQAQTTNDSIAVEESKGKSLSNVLQSSGDAKEALQIRDQILEKLKDLNSDQVPEVDVKQVPEGILISLTDSLDFDMFTVGSAQPQPQLISLMEKISQIIQTYDGKIILRGHTDSRPFKTGTNDNWRLSASRAQMAYYMLVRAGLDEKKVERIEGYADHSPKFPDQPELAGNRRIEILLKAKPQ